jgi:hypothetical protein
LSEKWPRPRVKCECGEELVLKWGEIKKVHFSHLPGKSSSCTSNGETHIHKFAKEVLARFLTKGGRVKISTNCCACYEEDSIITPIVRKGIVEYQLEGGGVADIAGLDSEACIAFVLEVFHSNRTKTEMRLDYEWYELDAYEILNRWDSKDEVTKIWEFRDLRSDRCCKSKGCLSMWDLAEKLGYYEEYTVGRYITKSRREIDMVVRGSYVVEKVLVRWYIYPDPIEELDKITKKKLWNEIVKRERCIMCRKVPEGEIDFYRPFCRSCYKDVKNQGIKDDSELERMKISPETRWELRKKYTWLDSTPGKWGNGSNCVFCGSDYMDNNDELSEYWEIGSDFVSGYIWWFGDKKCCCTRCLEEKMTGV